MNFRNYREAEAYIDGLINYERLLGGGLKYDTKAFDLENFRKFLVGLGNPHHQYVAIHVAGTKGKGSTCTYLCSALVSAGLRCGLYTSPHIDSYRERIRINNRMISAAEFTGYVARVAEFVENKRAGEETVGFRTVFELLTATALLAFAEQSVDVAIMETGLGGRLDATNVFNTAVKHPLFSVITAIGLDHVSILGETIEEIAAEKAAIIQAHSTVILGPQREEWRDVVLQAIHRRMDEVGNSSPVYDAERLFTVKSDFPANPENSIPGKVRREFTWQNDEDNGIPVPPLFQTEPRLSFVSPMPGRHQDRNFQTVLATLVAMENVTARVSSNDNTFLPVRFDRSRLARGFRTSCLPGRMEVVTSDPLVIVDGAHCQLSAAALADTFRSSFGDREVILVMGFMRDKLISQICSVVATQLRVAGVMVCQPATRRAMPLEEAMAIARTTFDPAPVQAFQAPHDAIAAAWNRLQGDQAIIVFGSMYLTGPARRAIKSLAQP